MRSDFNKILLISALYILVSISVSSYFIHCITDDMEQARHIEQMAGYTQDSSPSLPITWYLSSPFLLVRKDVTLCDYSRTVLAMLYNRYPDQELSSIESTLHDKSGHGYYMLWQAEEAIGQLEAEAEKEFGVSISDKDLSDICWIEDITEPTKAVARFAAIRAAAGSEIGYLYDKAVIDYNTGMRWDITMYITYVLFMMFTIFILTYLSIRLFARLHHNNTGIPMP